MTRDGFAAYLPPEVLQTTRPLSLGDAASDAYSNFSRFRTDLMADLGHVARLEARREPFEAFAAVHTAPYLDAIRRDAEGTITNDEVHPYHDINRGLTRDHRDAPLLSESAP